jgi:hypothetical protein
MAGMEEDSTRYEVDWFITTKSPVKEQDKWVAEIISCTIDGNEFVYEFNENKPDEAPKKVVTTDVGVKKEEKPTEKPTEDIARIDREIELSKQRERESKQRQQEVETKFQRIKELKEMGFTNQEILDLLK